MCRNLEEKTARCPGVQWQTRTVRVLKNCPQVMVQQLSQREREMAYGLRKVPKRCLKKKITLAEIREVIYQDRVRRRRSDRTVAATRPAINSLYRLFKGKTWNRVAKSAKSAKSVKKTIRKGMLLPVTERKIPKIIKKLEKQWPDDTVTAALIKGELDIRIRKMNATGRYPRQKLPAVRTVQKYIYKSGRRARKNRQKPPLSDSNKRERVRWGRKNGRRSVTAWKRYCMAYDEKAFHFYSSTSQKNVQRGKGKKFSYRLPSEGLEFSRPSELKHWTNGKKINVLCIVGAGRVLVWKYYTGALNGSTWSDLLHTEVAPALAEMPSPGRTFILRDNAPQSHNAKVALDTEALLRMRVEKQPSNSPDCSPLDYGLWKLIVKKMRMTERRWQKRNPRKIWKETLAEYKIRLRQTAKRLTQNEVERCMGKMKRVCAQLVERSGGHIPCD